jgi:Flp pilus assembly protein TadG
MLRNRSKRRSGSSIVEFALLMPWYAFLFVAAYDFGFYSYGLIATENAARVAAMYCSGSDSLASNCNTFISPATSSAACKYALGALQNLPNVGSSMNACSTTVLVSASLVTGASSPDGADAAQVTVQYTTPSLIPIPALLPGAITFVRTVTMRVLT